MLRTYEKLRIGIVVVTLLFISTLLFVRYSGIEKPGIERHSVSAYFHFPKDDRGKFPDDDRGWRVRDVFVAALATIGIMLIVYRGYTTGENVALTTAGAALIGVAVFPMDWPVVPGAVQSVTARTHYTCAVIFFAGLTYVCLRESRNSLADSAAGDPERENHFVRVYCALGVAMIALPLLSFLPYLIGHFDGNPGLGENYVFWVELSGVFVFMVYWVVKTVELRLPLASAEGGAVAVPAAPSPPSTRAQWVAANCAIVTAIAAIFGVYSFYAATERERLKAAQEAIARIYPMDSEVKRLQSLNPVLRPLTRSDPDGKLWEAEKNKGNNRTEFNALCSNYGNLFEYFLLIRDNLLDHPQGKWLVTGWDEYMKDVCQNSFAFRGYIANTRKVWSKQLIEKFDEYIIDEHGQPLPVAKDVPVAPPRPN